MQNNHRVLHREDDLLPFTTSGYLNQPSVNKLNPATATLKRHLASGSTAPSASSSAAVAMATAPVAAAASSNIYDHLGETTGASKQAALITSRKVATLNAAHAHTASNMMAYGSKPPKAADDSGL